MARDKRSVEQTAIDVLYMRRCLELAAQAAGQTAPNPEVGCVIVGANGTVLAEGYHRAAGQLHAEADALTNLARRGGKARGATLYCNLEPCRHRSQRRTSPCTDAILAAGIARVVYGVGDPIAGHGGGGRVLARAGVLVTKDILRDECRELNRGFFSVAERGRPWFVQKAAISLDGKLATASGESKWITGEDARTDGRRWRQLCDVVIVGVGTIIADDPALTTRLSGEASRAMNAAKVARGYKGRDPMRVVVDSQLSTPPSARVLPNYAKESTARVVIATTDVTLAAAQRAPRSALGKRLAALLAAGAEVWPVSAGKAGKVRKTGRATQAVVDVTALSRILAAQGCQMVLVEGGARVHASWVEAGLTDELVLYLAPLAIGGAGPAWLGGTGAKTLSVAPRFALWEPPVAIGNDLRLRFRRLPLRAI